MSSESCLVFPCMLLTLSAQPASMSSFLSLLPYYSSSRRHSNGHGVGIGDSGFCLDSEVDDEEACRQQRDDDNKRFYLSFSWRRSRRAGSNIVAFLWFRACYLSRSFVRRKPSRRSFCRAVAFLLMLLYGPVMLLILCSDSDLRLEGRFNS